MPETILGQIGNKVGGWVHPLALGAGVTDSKDYFTELVYTSGDLTAINTYVDNTKTVHLFNKVFTYDTTKRLIKVVTTKYNSGENNILTVDLSYDSNGGLESITKDYA